MTKKETVTTKQRSGLWCQAPLLYFILFKVIDAQGFADAVHDLAGAFAGAGGAGLKDIFKGFFIVFEFGAAFAHRSEKVIQQAGEPFLPLPITRLAGFIP